MRDTYGDNWSGNKWQGFGLNETVTDDDNGGKSKTVTFDSPCTSKSNESLKNITDKKVNESKSDSANKSLTDDSKIVANKRDQCCTAKNATCGSCSSNMTMTEYCTGSRLNITGCPEYIKLQKSSQSRNSSKTEQNSTKIIKNDDDDDVELDEENEDDEDNWAGGKTSFYM
jgi:hypothetical protein